MNEKLSNNSENVQDAKNEWTDLGDVPFAGGRVEDVEKARAMADAENSDRSIAAEETRAASIAESKDYKARGELIEDLRNQGFSTDQIKQIFNNPDKIRESAAEHSNHADKQGEKAGYLYDAEHHENQNN